MATRREFAKAASAWAVLAGATPAVGAPKATDQHDDFLDLAVQRTSLQHPAFTAWATPRALKMVETGDDLTHLWRAEIEPLVQRGQARIAGLTPGYSAFVLGELAGDHGHGLVWCLPAKRLAEHRLASAPTTAANIDPRLSAVEINSASPLCWMLAPAGIDFHMVPNCGRSRKSSPPSL